MEFIKKGENYLIKNSNGRVVSEKEKLELENGELIIKDITSNECQQETTKKIKKNKKRIKEIMEEDLKNKNLIREVETYDTLEETTEKIKKNKKRIAEIEKENVKINIDLQPIDSERVAKYIKEQTALHKEVDNDTIEETTETI